MSLKLTGGIILATGENGEFQVLEGSCICIEDKYIKYIGPDRDAPECDAEKDMRGMILMPGLVNAHGHGPMTLLRGVGGGLALQEWLESAIFPIEAKLTPKDIEIGERWAVMEMLAGGTTCVSEMYDFPEATWEVLKGSGIKGNVCRVGLSFSETEEIPKNRFNECVNIVKNLKDDDDRVISEFCLHSEYLTNEGFVRNIVEANKSLHANINVHVSETRREHEECKQRHGGLTPIGYLDKMGILDENTYAAHCVWVEDSDIEIMKEKKVSPVFNPSSNCKLASGFAPIDKMLEKGLNVAIGTDGCASNDNLNMFEELHLGSLLIKNKASDATVLNAGQVLKMATVNGARALGRTDTGELKVGKRADIIAVSMDKPHMYPAFDIMNLLVYSAQASDVVMTMVDGKILYENGIYKTIDAEKARFETKDAIARIYA